jgi:hypothetical protein
MKRKFMKKYYISKDNKVEEVSFSEYMMYQKRAGYYINDEEVMKSFYDDEYNISGWIKED